MITLNNYRPSPVTGPYRRRLRWIEIAMSILGHVAIGSLMAYAVLGMIPGVWE